MAKEIHSYLVIFPLTKFCLFNIGAPEMEMLPLYQLIFSQPGLPLLVKDKWGLTVIEFARRSNRPIAVKMMEDYVKKYNLKEEN